MLHEDGLTNVQKLTNFGGNLLHLAVYRQSDIFMMQHFHSYLCKSCTKVPDQKNLEGEGQA